MGPLFLIVMIAIGAAALELTTETAGEFFAMYMVDPADYGASDRDPETIGDAVDQPAGIVEGADANVLLAALNPSQIDGENDGHINGYVDGAATALATGVAEPEDRADGQPAPAAAEADAGQDDMLVPASLANDIEAVSPMAGDEASSALLALIGDTPHRQLDGSVFLPITTQWVFGLRTVLGERVNVPATAELPGRTVINPGSSALVQVSNQGFIEAHDGSYPFVGQRVKRGQLLAYLRPANDHLGQTQLQERIQELINLIDLSRKRMARLEEVIYVRYRESKIEEIRVEIRGLQRQLEILQNAMDMRYELRAKTDGVVSRVEAQIGEYLDPGETVFEIVDPSKLWVEANAFDLDVIQGIDSAAAYTADGRPIKLRFIGGGLRLSNQATPLRFEVLDAAPDLSVDNPVTVVIRSGAERIEGVKVPRRSVVRTGDGRQMVWERRSAERFVAHHVSTRPLDADTVLVVSGLSAGTRVVTEGAAALDQVR